MTFDEMERIFEILEKNHFNLIVAYMDLESYAIINYFFNSLTFIYFMDCR
jgi:hypothetical protein